MTQCWLQGSMRKLGGCYHMRKNYNIFMFIKYCIKSCIRLLICAYIQQSEQSRMSRFISPCYVQLKPETYSRQGALVVTLTCYGAL